MLCQLYTFVTWPAPPNPLEHPGEEVARQQRGAYPDLAPARLEAAPEDGFARALAAAERLGRELVDAAPAAGRIEATDRTSWFGFKDDVVVRIQPDEEGTAGSRTGPAIIASRGA